MATDASSLPEVSEPIPIELNKVTGMITTPVDISMLKCDAGSDSYCTSSFGLNNCCMSYKVYNYTIPSEEWTVNQTEAIANFTSTFGFPTDVNVTEHFC